MIVPTCLSPPEPIVVNISTPAKIPQPSPLHTLTIPIQKKEEEKLIGGRASAKERYWKIPICDDDDDGYTIAITPVLPTEEPDNSLSMGDEHLDTIPATELDEVIKSSVEDLVPIPSEFEGIFDNMCDVPLCNNSTPP
ncbi:hypothetical protein Tco_0257338 [Tanacetum coccineum]